MYTKTSKPAIITKIRNSKIETKKSFTTLNTIIKEMENEDSDLNNPDDDGKEKSHFQFQETY